MRDVVSDTFYMAEILRKQYEKIFSTPVSVQMREQVDDVWNQGLSNFAFLQLTDWKRKFSNTLKAYSAAGPDEFPDTLLKKCAGELC